MRLLRNKFSHVSNDTVREFEESMLRIPNIALLKNHFNIKYFILFLPFKFFCKFGINIVRRPSGKNKKNAWKDKKHLFTILMGMNWSLIKPYVLGSCHNKSIFLFDAWPYSYDSIVGFCNYYKIDYLFLTSTRSTEIIKKRIPNTRVEYIPEAIKFDEYKFLDYSEKTIDIVAIGRKWDLYHSLIVDGLRSKNVNYWYSPVSTNGKLLFPDRESFILGLAKSKISVCVPQNITHPQKAGDVETMTVRYLQSMASKCLVIGLAPKEMVDLFGYNPVITIDLDNPVEQIINILDHFDEYIPLIEKNYVAVKNNHTWNNRIQDMIEIWSRGQ